jgi:DNA (cytosine-5)-methyltransferase 1
MVFEEVCAELEDIGYKVAPCIIPACAVGAPHRRERIWFVAMHSNGSSQQGEYITQQRKGKFNRPNSRHEFNNFQNFPTQSPICDGNDGISNRLDGITFSKWRNESIKAGGNAIVPQVAYQIFKAIEKLHV